PPTAQVSIHLDGDALVLDGSKSLRAEHSGVPLQHFSWSLHRALSAAEFVGATSTPSPSDLVPTAPPHAPVPIASGRTVTAQVPENDGDYLYELEITDALGRSDVARVPVRVNKGRAVLKPSIPDSPSWMDGAVLYGVLPP